MTQGQFHIANSTHTREQFLVGAAQIMEEHPYVVWEWIYGKPRTGAQNAALHVWCRMLAEHLNSLGLCVQDFFKETYEVPFSPGIVKDNVWRPMQIAVAGQESSSDLTTVQMTEIYDYVNRALANKGIQAPAWPERKK